MRINIGTIYRVAKDGLEKARRMLPDGCELDYQLTIKNYKGEIVSRISHDSHTTAKPKYDCPIMPPMDYKTDGPKEAERDIREIRLKKEISEAEVKLHEMTKLLEQTLFTANDLCNKLNEIDKISKGGCKCQHM